MNFEANQTSPVRFIERWGLFSATQPLSRPVSSNDAAYVAHTGVGKLGWRHFRRLAYYTFSGQQAFYREQFDPTWQRGLWLYRGVPQLGDALMDLAPRSLLVEHGLTIDLCTEPHLATLFDGDPWFRQVFTPDSVTAAASPCVDQYDFVIVQSHKSRSLRDKRRLFRKLPWVSMHGFYTGPEFHRAEFATQRLIDLLAHPLDDAAFHAHARQKLKPLPTPPQTQSSTLAIAFAMGGVDPLRTYTAWLAVAKLLSDRFELTVTLLGSANAVEAAEHFVTHFAGHIENRVNQTSLAQCRALMQTQDVVVAGDGGLMHLAVTTQARLVSLFHAGVRPEWRLPPDCAAASLQSATQQVDALMPTRIAALITKVAQAKLACSA